MKKMNVEWGLYNRNWMRSDQSGRQDSSGTQQAGKKHVPTLSKENVKENKESILGYLGKVFNFDRFFSMTEVVFHKSF